MSLWRYPRTAAALCIAAVLACAAAPRRIFGRQ